MLQLIGEYECKIDAKARVMLPAALKKQLTGSNADKFVVNRGFEKHLTLYPYEVWQTESAEVNKLNMYNKQNRDFARYFFRGATEISLDASSRLLLPKSLLEYADIKSDMVLFAYGNKIEVWSASLYEATLDNEPQNFADLAEAVMGGKKGDE